MDNAIMGRLFPYNRFGSAENTQKKDILTPKVNKCTTSTTTAIQCPAYAELYPDYDGSKPSTKRIVKRQHSWHSKFMPQTLANSTIKADASHVTSSRNTIFNTATSDCQRQLSQTDDRDALICAVKKPKVFNCMKAFLFRKLFQTQTAIVINKETSQEKEQKQTLDIDDDVTSDYDELDQLDSSYNADEEDEATDCSCSCTSADEQLELPENPAQQKISSPFKSALSLSCWQNNTDTQSDTTTDEESPALVEDSDAGISDCCQLLNERKRLPVRKQRQHAKTRWIIDDDDEDELLETSWYQPRITTKAALERLQCATPGCFLVRRKRRTFELWLRVVGKTKHFTVLHSTADQRFKLKGAKKQFTSLKALVTHHSLMAEQLPMTLTLPREKPLLTLTSMRCADDFDTLESLQILGILQSLQAKSFDCA